VEYDAAGRLLSITDALGLTSRVGYRGGKRVRRATDDAVRDKPVQLWRGRDDALGGADECGEGDGKDREPAHSAGDWLLGATGSKRGESSQRLSQQPQHILLGRDGERPASSGLHKGGNPVLASRADEHEPDGGSAREREEAVGRSGMVHLSGPDHKSCAQGTCDKPGTIAGVLPDGSKQVELQHARQGTSRIDSRGRETHYEYAANGFVSEYLLQRVPERIAQRQAS
jgi:YD repeat-containing protein